MPRQSSLRIKRTGKHRYWTACINGQKHSFGNVKKVSRHEAMVAFADALKAVPPKRPRKAETHLNIDELPLAISVAQFAKLISCYPRTVCRMIQRNEIPAQKLNLGSKRPTYRIPTSVLREMVGIDEEPVYVSVVGSFE